MKKLIVTLTLLISTGCVTQNTKTTSTPSSCRGEWSERVNGELKKYNQYWHTGLKACVTENVALTTWEETSEKRIRDGVTCTPQSDLPSMWLKASNNFYNYRDGKIYIHLDAATGVAHRLLLGTAKNGKTIFARQEFCYYLRTDIENEPVNPKDYGRQILFDLELSATSITVTPMEIFKYTVAGPNINLARFDMNDDIDWTFCPARTTPWGFCDELRNGNEMFYPDDPDQATKDKLVNEAILIRSEFNYETITQTEFDLAWDDALENIEIGTPEWIENTGAWEYVVSGIPDEPLYIGRAWREYLRRERPSMPDVDSSKGRVICYPARRSTTYSDGSSGQVYGEACYNNGDYTFNEGN